MRVLSVVMTHGERSKTVSRMVTRIRAFSVPSDVYIWNNGPYDITVEGARVINGVNARGEVQKLTLPLVLSQYDVFFYCDDDLTVHECFLENALRLLDRHGHFLVCTGGSVIEGDDPLRRRWVPSSSFPARPFYADFGDLGCFAVRRENVWRMLTSGVMASQPWNTDVFFSASYWNSGGIIYVPEQPDESRLCLRPDPEHFNGLCAEPGFARQRDRAVEALLSRGWRPKPRGVQDEAPLFWS